MERSSRFVAVVVFLAVGVVFSVETLLVDGVQQRSNLSPYFRLSHLLCFSTAWGSFISVTFGGFFIFKIIPRHQFGNLRSKMFPLYFALSGACCGISVVSFGYLHPWKSSSMVEKYQTGFLVSAFVFNLFSLFVFTPMTVEVMKKKHKVEREEDIGKEVGWIKNTEAAKRNAKLAAVNRKFGVVHALSATVHVIPFFSLSMHSWYLAGNFNNL